MPPLVKLMIKNAAIGFVASAAFVALLIWSDTAQLGSLIAGSPFGWLAAAMLVFFTALTFGSVQIGIAIMGLGRNDGGSGRRKRRAPSDHPVQQFATVAQPAAVLDRHRNASL